MAHCHETSNAINASVRCEQKRLERLSETVPTNNWMPQAVRPGIPDRQTSHTESPSAIGPELSWWRGVTRSCQVADRRCCRDDLCVGSNDVYKSILRRHRYRSMKCWNCEGNYNCKTVNSLTVPWWKANPRSGCCVDVRTSEFWAHCRVHIYIGPDCLIFSMSVGSAISIWAWFIYSESDFPIILMTNEERTMPPKTVPSGHLDRARW